MQARWAGMLGLWCQSISSLATADKTWVAEWAALSLPLCMWQYDLATGIRDGNGNGLSFLVINNGCSEEIEKGSKVEAKVHSYYKCHLFKYQDHWKGILFIFLLWKIEGICQRVSPQWSQYRKQGNKRSTGSCRFSHYIIHQKIKLTVTYHLCCLMLSSSF